MFNYLKYRYRLRILTNKQKKDSQLYELLIKKARKEKQSEEEIETLSGEGFFEYLSSQEDIDVLITNYLRNKANTLFVPLPEYSDQKMWDECNINSQQKVLTTLGINMINTAIRKERLDRLEIFFKFLVPLVGIIGAVTGLIAVIKK